MSKKDLANVTTNLAELTGTLPTQHRTVPRPAAPDTPAAPAEPVIQFSLSMRKRLRKELARLVDDADMTMRAFVLNALKGKDLSVGDDDLLDLRKRQP